MSRSGTALLRATHLAPTVAVTAFAAVLAAAAGRGPWGTALVTAAVLTGQCSIGWANDYVDRHRDRRVGRGDKPIVAGDVDARTVGRAAAVAAVATVPLSFASGATAGMAHVAAVALGWAYDLGLKRTAASVLAYAGAFGLLPVFVSLGPPVSTPGPWWWAGAGALLGSGAHFLNALPDLDDDDATAVRGLPQRLGATGSLAAGTGLLGAGVAVVGLGPDGVPGGARLVALVVGTVCVLGALAVGVRGRLRLAFPLAIAAAGAVVVAFATVADQLR